MNLAQFITARPLYGWILIFVCVAGGLYGVENVGRLEDPAFPIKRAYVITAYPGASALEVEQEVTDRIESALQELPYVETMTSKSVPGRSEIMVELGEEYGSDETDQIYDELRRRVLEAGARLPPGVFTPHVEDDFGDVFGILYTVAAPGYSDSELKDIARSIATRLKLVPAVAKVSTQGVPEEAVYLELEHEKLTQLGLSVGDLAQKIHAENEMVSAGSAAFEGRRLRIAPPAALDSVDTLRELKIGQPGSNGVVRLGDIATLKRASVEVPAEIIRFNGERVFTVGVSVTPGQNVVRVGKDVDRAMGLIKQSLPLGVSVAPIYEQHKVVDASIANFMQNLMISVATVVVALCLFMGWRAGTVVGVVLLITVLGTVGFMYLFKIELQRISLGALMIAMGMLVDNGIVIAEGMVVGVRRGLSAQEAAARSVARTQYALLGATIIGILAFAPISLSDDNSGHFLISLFQVIAISLLLSWLLAITVIPMLGSLLLKPGKPVDEAELYGAWYFVPYRKMIEFGLRRSWLTSLIIVAITSVCLYSVSFVKTSFFPTNNSPLFFVDYRLQEGTDILTTAADIVALETEIMGRDDVVSIASFIGRGAPRFITMAAPEQPNPAYARLIVRVHDVGMMGEIMQETGAFIRASRPDAEILISRQEFSPSGTSKIVMRYSGPDAQVLRSLADQTLDVYLQHELLDRKTDWRPQSLQLVPVYDEANARLAGLSRNDVSRALAYNTLGVNIGLMRDNDKLIPIIARAPDAERADLTGLINRQVWSPTQRQYVPLSQVITQFDVEAENTTVFRRQRLRTIEAQSNPPPGENINEYFEKVRPDVESITLPEGYTREWGGDFESNKQANEALTVRLPAAFGAMFFITILMFGALKQPIVIWMTVPMIMCGVSLGLLATNLPLTFPSFLGVLSLAGMLIKNCIVLVDEIDQRLAEEEATLNTIMMASISRLRPVMLAALTTIVGLSPLLTDAFFREMAVCIMSGLAFATLLTLVAVPVFYRIALGQRIRVS